MVFFPKNSTTEINTEERTVSYVSNIPILINRKYMECKDEHPF